AWYLQRNKDVAESGMDAALHYLRYGGNEGRAPSPQFDSRYYLLQNPDVAQSGQNPLVHYLRFGKAEGRLPLPPAFDAKKKIVEQPAKKISLEEQKRIDEKERKKQIYQKHPRLSEYKIENPQKISDAINFYIKNKLTKNKIA